MKANVTLQKTDLYQYGEIYQVNIELENGYKFNIKIEEHQYISFSMQFTKKELSGQFKNDETYS